MLAAPPFNPRYGRAVWSVTQILQALGKGPNLSHASPEDLERARLRGQLYHKAAHFLGEGDLLKSSIDPKIAPFLEAKQKWIALSGARIVACEVKVESARWGYVGTLDSAAFLGGVRVLVDDKTGAVFDKEFCELQLGAYAVAWDEQHHREPVGGLIGLHLRDDETFRSHLFNALAAKAKWLRELGKFKEGGQANKEEGIEKGGD